MPENLKVAENERFPRGVHLQTKTGSCSPSSHSPLGASLEASGEAFVGRGANLHQCRLINEQIR